MHAVNTKTQTLNRISSNYKLSLNPSCEGDAKLVGWCILQIN